MGLRRWRGVARALRGGAGGGRGAARRRRRRSARITLGLDARVPRRRRGRRGAAAAGARARASRSAPGEETVRAYVLPRRAAARCAATTRRALEAMVAGERAAARLGMRGSFGRFMYVNAIDDLLRARPLGRGRAARSTRPSAWSSSVTGAVMHHANAGQLRALRGDAAAARAHLEQAAEAAQRAACRASSSRRCSRRGRRWRSPRRDPDAARRHVEAALARSASPRTRSTRPSLHGSACARRPSWPSARARAGRRTRRGGRSRAEALLADLDRTLAAADARAARGAGPARARARRAEPRRRRAAAAAVARRPSRPGTRSASRYPAAYARLRAAEAMLTAGGDRAAAAELLADAHARRARSAPRPLREEVERSPARARLTWSRRPRPRAGAGRRRAG